MRGAQARAYQLGYATFLGDSDETQEIEDLLLGRLATQVDGFVLASPRLDEQRIRAHACRRPLVVINRDVEGISRVLVDTAVGFVQAVHHLAELGHRCIAYVGAPRASWSNEQRTRAVVETGEKLGIDVVRIAAVRPSHEAGRSCVERFLKSGATAVLAVDDVVAQGMMAGLADRGLSVPGDFSVVGCDDVVATTTYPPLTTVSAHCSNAGSDAVDLLMAALNKASSAPECRVITGQLVLRATTGPAASEPGAAKQRARSTDDPSPGEPVSQST
jgi:LacI family transcriptional regulator